MTPLNGNYEGTVESCGWFTFESKQSGKEVPYMGLEIAVGDQKLNASLYFDSDVKTSGVDQGKTGVVVALEILESYGVPCDSKNPRKCDPSKFPAAMKGQKVKVHCKEVDGKQKVYLNKKARETADTATIARLWGEIVNDGTEPAPTPAPKGKGNPAAPAADDDNLVF